MDRSGKRGVIVIVIPRIYLRNPITVSNSGCTLSTGSILSSDSPLQSSIAFQVVPTAIVVGVDLVVVRFKVRTGEAEN